MVKISSGWRSFPDIRCEGFRLSEPLAPCSPNWKLLVELRQEIMQIESLRVHGLVAGSVDRPFAPRSVTIDLDAVAIGIVQINGLTHPMVGGAVNCHPVVDQALQGAGQFLSAGIEDGEVVQPRTSRLWRRP